jgi:FtsH-binding integral membrane protein
MVGVTCTFYSGALVLEALVLTAAVGFGLTAYTFYAVKRGADFG